MPPIILMGKTNNLCIRERLRNLQSPPLCRPLVLLPRVLSWRLCALNDPWAVEIDWIFLLVASRPLTCQPHWASSWGRASLAGAGSPWEWGHPSKSDGTCTQSPSARWLQIRWPSRLLWQHQPSLNFVTICVPCSVSQLQPKKTLILLLYPHSIVGAHDHE